MVATFADDFEVAGESAAPYEKYVLDGTASTWAKSGGKMSQTVGPTDVRSALVVPMDSVDGYVETFVASGLITGLVVRMSTSGWAGPCVFASADGTGAWSIRIWDGAAVTSTNTAGTPTAGQRIRLEATPTNCSLYFDGVLKAQVAPPTATAGQNRMGLYAFRPNDAAYHSIGISTPAAAIPLPIQDTFDRANGPLGTTSDGKAAWKFGSQGGGVNDYQVVSNQAKQLGAAGGYYQHAYVELASGVADMRVKADLVAPVPNYSGLAVRLSAANKYVSALPYGDGTVELLSWHTGSTGTVWASATGTGASAATWELEVVGHTYKVFRNGVEILSYTDTAGNHAATVFGAGLVSSGQNAIWDNFSVTEPVTATPPATPTGLTATGGVKQVATSWTAVTGATGYRLRRGTTVVYDGTATSFTETGLADETIYSYTVTAYNADGESAESAAVSATTAFAFGDYTPTGLAATTNRLTEILVTWDGVDGNLKTDGTVNRGYELFRDGVSLYTGIKSEYLDSPRPHLSSHAYSVRSFRTDPDQADTALFRDNFDRADSTTIGNDWTERTGDWDISAGTLRVLANASAAPHAATVTRSYPSADADITVKVVEKRDAGVALRWSGTQGYHIVTNGVVRYDAANPSGVFERTWTDVFVNGDEMRVHLLGSTFTLYRNGGQIQQFALGSATLNETVTTHGLRGGMNADYKSTFDDFVMNPAS